MIYFYDKDFLNKIKSKKKVHCLIIVLIMAIMLLTNVILIVSFADKPYGSNLRNAYQTASYVITIVLTFISGLYYEILYAPLKKYYYRIIETLNGKKEYSDVTVLRVYNDFSDKFGVKYKRFDALEWSDIQNDYVEREIYFDASVDINFEENQMVKLLTCGNLLLGYEVK
ncbi:MAG: hypothetical protein J6Q58_01650 [Clostridia bacterium]|nr:hypothetical protein [Clostridia bacterium]